MSEPLTLAQRLREATRPDFKLRFEAADELDRLRDANKALTAERDEARQSWGEAVKLYEQETARVDPLLAKLAKVEAERDEWQAAADRVWGKMADAEAETVTRINHWSELYSAELHRATRLSAELAEARKEGAGAKEAFRALDIADRLIERGYGMDTPKEWSKTFRQVAKARANSFLSISKEASHAE